MYREPPDVGSSPIPADGMPPMLNPLIEQDGLLAGGAADEPDASASDAEHIRSAGDAPPDFAPEPSPGRARWAWPTIVIVALIALGVQLYGPESLRVEADALGLGAAPTIDPGEAIELISRDLHRHPSLNDAVIVSAVLINRADQPVRWPRIELQLFDASQQVIGQRLLEPAEYLDPSADPEGRLGPNVRLPVVLEMVVEGSAPAGFSMSFH